MRTDKRIFALGFFDGVHLGHQALLKACCSLAAQMDVQAAAITFDGHPRSLFVDRVPPLINSAHDRQLLLRRCGIGPVYMFPVTKEVMSTPWRDFLEELVELGAAGFICGDDFHFGHKGQGNADRLRAFSQERGLPCVIVPEQTLDETRVSSTYIRSQIESGDMNTAIRFLGHPHLFTGKVIHGHKLGRRLGFPTANLVLPEQLVVPKFGVYACRCIIDGVRYAAVTNVGTRPTVAGTGITVEAWILDYQGDLYDREITLQFFRFLRAERKFPDLTALQQAIRADAEQTKEILKGFSDPMWD